MFHLHKGLRPNSRIVYRFSLPIYRWWTYRTRLHWPIGLRTKKNGQGEPGSVAGLALVVLCFCCSSWSWISILSFVLPFHLQNGPNSWRLLGFVFWETATLPEKLHPLPVKKKKTIAGRWVGAGGVLAGWVFCVDVFRVSGFFCPKWLAMASVSARTGLRVPWR